MANKPTLPTSGPSLGPYTFLWTGTDWQVLHGDANGYASVNVKASALPTGAATLIEQQAQTTLLGTIDADTSALAAVDYATQTTLAVVAGDTTSIDTKIPADPAREGGNLATLAAVDYATQTTLAVVAGDTTSMDTKMPADPAREGGNLATLAAVDFATSAKQDTGNTSLGTIAGDTTSMDGKMPADPAREGGNLATIAGDTTSIDGKVALAANQGKAPVIVKSGSVATYAGAQITLSGLTAGTTYGIVCFTCRLTGGTAGNTTQPSIGQATGFAQGDMDDRYKISATIDKDAVRTVDNLVGPVPITADGSGNIYIKGASPAAADSTFYYRVDLVEMRAGA